MNQTSALSVNTKEEELLWNSKNQSNEERNHLKSKSKKVKVNSREFKRSIIQELKRTTLRIISNSFIILRRDHTVFTMIHRISDEKGIIYKSTKM